MSLQELRLACLGDRDALALGREQGSAWSDWLQPINEQQPTGDDPSYEDDFQCLREQVNKLSGADTEQVVRLGEKLLTHTCKDLRVVTYYLWARLQRDGEAGLADGLALLAALVERFGAQLLPARPNSRRLALEWLAADKLLSSLSLYPEVVQAEAERTVAALVWLEHGLLAWPEDQRPQLGPLYGALSARLARSGGADALVPQHSASAEPSGAGGVPPPVAIKSGRDLLDSGRALGAYLRDQLRGWLAAHHLMKSLRWDMVHETPPEDSHGNTRLAAPRGDYRVQLKRLHVQQRWGELLDLVERVYAEAVNHFWLDLQWYLYQALAGQPAPRDSWAGIVKRDLGMLLERLPGLEHLKWNDGSAFADETTREWIAQQVIGNRPAQWLPVAPAAAQDDVLALQNEAQAQADSHGVEQALAWLAARPQLHSGREHWLLRLLMARVAEQCGKNELAVHLLGELEQVAQRQGLAQWEPQLNFEVKARLLKLLRMKTQRSDADKPALARRMEALLASLVAIDPVRAAVLCG